MLLMGKSTISTGPFSIALLTEPEGFPSASKTYKTSIFHNQPLGKDFGLDHPTGFTLYTVETSFVVIFRPSQDGAPKIAKLP